MHSRIHLKPLSCFLLSAFLTLAGLSAHAELLIRPGDRLVLNGDSITAQQIYSVFIEEYLLACQPVPDLKTDNCGTGGATAGYFRDRVETDILPFNPTVITSFFGMNDGRYQPVRPENRDAYRSSLLAALHKLKDSGVRTFFVAGPGCVDPALFKKNDVTADGYNETLKDLSGIAREAAGEIGGTFVDVHGTMMKTMRGVKEARAADAFFMDGKGDGIHPPPAGHLAIAYAFLKAFGCEGNIGTITVDLASDTAEATEGHRIIAAKGGAITIESTRYPFCFVGSINAAAVLPYLPFNDDLNRYLLVVKGLGAPAANITWGRETRRFDTARLVRGINLAAEFPQNPFCDRFAALQETVISQQNMEIAIAGSILHNSNRFKILHPGQDDRVEEIVKTGLELQGKLGGLSAAAVTPVTHTIKIEPAL